MRTLSPMLFCVVVACSTKSSTEGPKGDPGPQGTAGAQGAKGETGAAGICDTSSCPQVTSINGLSGGTVNGATSFSSTVTLSSAEISTGSAKPTGIIIESGGHKTSINGFYCGKHDSVDGDLHSNSNHSFDALSPMRRGKQYCQIACSDVAAHPCSTAEIQVAQQLGGGEGVSPNTAVPMPPDSVIGWVVTPDPTASCNDFGGASTDQGTVFSLGSDEGGFERQACNVTHSLFCCL